MNQFRFTACKATDVVVLKIVGQVVGIEQSAVEVLLSLRCPMSQL